MDGQTGEFVETALAFIRNNLLITILLASGVIFLGIGLMQFINSQEEIVFESANQDSKVSTTSNALQDSAAKIYVDVEGQVMNPGVYDLPLDSRIKDALTKAGGLTESANKEYVAKSLNLAQKLSDGAKIYIPSVEEPQPVTSDSGLININTSTASQLESLPKIGPATAQKIIDARPYAKVEELIEKKALSTAVFESIRDKITVY